MVGGILGVVAPLAAIRAQSIYPTPYSFSTLAGTPNLPGASDGAPVSASFSYPYGVSVDSAGNLYIADTANHTIRKITPNATVSTLAGSTNNLGATDGAGDVAKFNSPTGIAVDRSGNVYVSDRENHTIRKISPAGQVSTLAGSPGNSGSADGTGSAARFYFPTGLAVDSSGNIFVADSGNLTIRKITTGGQVTTLAGSTGRSGSVDGTGNAALFIFPFGVATDATGNVFVSDRSARTVRKINTAGEVTTLAGAASNAAGSTDGTGSGARFNNPGCLTVDSSGNLYLADTNNHTIRRITSSGVVTTWAGDPPFSGSENGPGNQALFSFPIGIALDSTGTVFVADTNNSTIRKITSSAVVSTLAGKPKVYGSTDGSGRSVQFNFPESTAVDNAGNVYVADRDNHTIRKISRNGIVTTLAGSAGVSGAADGIGTNARFNFPFRVVIDAAGNLLVSDTYNHTIRKVTSTGLVTTLAGSAGNAGATDGAGSEARFRFPDGLAVDAAGNVLVADTYNQTIRKVTGAGLVTTLAGSAGIVGATDGAGADARFRYPGGLALDPAGNVFVADTDNHTIRKITSGGLVTTFAGQAATSGSTDGSSTTARFTFPYGVAVDQTGNVFVADTYNHTIRKLSPFGDATTLAGSPGSTGSTDALGSVARFYYPTGLSVDSTGTIYVADILNHTIRKISTAGAVTTLAGTTRNNGATDGAAGIAQFSTPRRLALDGSGNVYVADFDNNTIRKITSTGIVTTLAGLPGSSGTTNGTGAAARFYGPSGVATDALGNIFVADYYNHTIRKITGDGVVSTLAGSPGLAGAADGIGSAARFNFPAGMSADAEGNVFVADTQSHTIRKISAAGVVTTVAGSAGIQGSTDGTGTLARFTFPNSATVDRAGNIYVADYVNHTIRKISPAGVVTTIAGLAGISGSADGVGGTARFNSPFDTSVDNVGNVYVAEIFGKTIRKISAAGPVTTLAGTPGVSAPTNGIGAGAGFRNPSGIAVDPLLNLYVADSDNHTIRFGVPTAISTEPLTGSGLYGQAFLLNASFAGAPASYIASGLPPGLSINPSTGEISGTPTAPGTYIVPITASNSLGTATATLTIAIPAPPAPAITSSLAGSGFVGAAYRYTITASNAPGSFNATGLPPGLVVNTTTGAITGTPTVAGTYNVTIAAANLGGVDSKTLVLTLTIPPAPVLSGGFVTTGKLRFPYSYVITASNAPTSYNATGLPPGLSINTSTGEIAGALTGLGTYLVTIAAANAGGTASTTLSISVTQAPQDSLLSGTQSDLLLENIATGERVIWQMNGGNIAGSANLPTFTAGWHFAGTGDFNGDGRSDIVLQNTMNGDRVVWLMNGSTITGSLGLPVLPLVWQFACVGDINGDGKPDILLQNTATNDRIVWLMDGVTITGSVALPALPSAWQFCGIMDFNGDGQADVLIQNTDTGERIIWILNAQLGITQSLALPTFYAGWRFAGVGRFTPDNLPNIILQNTLTGDRVLWSINPAGQIAGSTALPALPVVWSFAGPALNRAKPPAPSDLNRDGQSDLFLTNTTTGDRIVWLMNGSSIAGSVGLPTLPPAWEITGSADFNADGMNDILLQNTATGDRIIWLMNGATIAGSVALPTLDTPWRFAAIGDINLDGQPDIILQNQTTGERVIWLMDRTTIAGSIALPTLPLSWTIAAAGSFTADTRANLLLENTTTGDRLFWTLNPNGSIFNSVGLPTFTSGWRFAGSADFNSDRHPDIILQNTISGDRVIWLMNRTTIAGSVGLPSLPTSWRIKN